MKIDKKYLDPNVAEIPTIAAKAQLVAQEEIAVAQNVVQVIPATYTFTREYDFEEVINLVALPEGAKVFRVYISEMPADETTFMSPNVTGTMGVTGSPEALGGTGSFSSMGFSMNPKILPAVGASAYLTTTIKDPVNGATATERLSGVTVNIFVEYTMG